jgi:hypothetical protein
MSKVVYLLGAGASYGIRHKEAPAGTKSLIVEGLPIVKEINDELNVVIDWLKVERETDKTTIVEFLDKKSSVEELKPSLIEDFNWLKENCAKHATIDTFARKLHIRCEAQSYSRLKFLLSTFFLIEQVIHPYDKRYDTFFANIVNRNGEIPDNILIMTWNYDIQLDIAYDEYQNGRLKTYVAGDPLILLPMQRCSKSMVLPIIMAIAISNRGHSWKTKKLESFAVYSTNTTFLLNMVIQVTVLWKCILHGMKLVLMK